MTKLEAVHKKSFENKVHILASTKVGCFSCLKIFKPNQVKDYTKEKSGKETAICPFCGIDAVIHEDKSLTIDANFLKKMKNKFF